MGKKKGAEKGAEKKAPEASAPAPAPAKKEEEKGGKHKGRPAMPSGSQAGPEGVGRMHDAMGRRGSMYNVNVQG